MLRFEKFQRNYDSAIDTINHFLTDDSHESSMKELTLWLMETEINPYSFLPELWAASLENAQSFASLLGHISHALYDDGDITFVTVNNCPRIVFANRYDIEANRQLALSKTEIDSEGRRNRLLYQVEILTIKPEEFGLLAEKYHESEIRRCFLGDAEHNLEWAISHYRKYKCWQDSWISDFHDGVEE